jgi:methyl-accepting chemotaxis protein
MKTKFISTLFIITVIFAPSFLTFYTFSKSLDISVITALSFLVLIILIFYIKILKQKKALTNIKNDFESQKDTIEKEKVKIQNEFEKFKTESFNSKSQAKVFDETAIKMGENNSFYKNALNNLFISIIKNVTDTTTPLSDNLSEIQKNMSEFVKHVKQYDSEIIQRTGINKIVDNNKNMTDMVSEVSNRIKEMFDVFNKNLNSLENTINKVFQSSLQIHDIADKINILSINAAIESARSGDLGKGFKVISDEIKVLSGKTFSFLKEIDNTVVDSKKVLENIHNDFIIRENKIIEIISNEESYSGSSYNIFIEYYNNFQDIYNLFQSFMEIVTDKVTKISPVLQLHEITVQEIENLNHVVTDFISANEEIISKKFIISEKTDLNNARFLTETIRKRLTTSRELDSLEKTIDELGYKGSIDLKRKTADIELF